MKSLFILNICRERFLTFVFNCQNIIDLNFKTILFIIN